MEAYNELLKRNHITHTIDLRIRCSPEELKLISEHVFRGIIVQTQEASCKTPSHPQ
jgi:hypothetical protein